MEEYMQDEWRIFDMDVNGSIEIINVNGYSFSGVTQGQNQTGMSYYNNLIKNLNTKAALFKDSVYTESARAFGTK